MSCDELQAQLDEQLHSLAEQYETLGTVTLGQLVQAARLGREALEKLASIRAECSVGANATIYHDPIIPLEVGLTVNASTEGREPEAAVCASINLDLGALAEEIRALAESYEEQPARLLNALHAMLSDAASALRVLLERLEKGEKPVVDLDYPQASITLEHCEPINDPREAGERLLAWLRETAGRIGVPVEPEEGEEGPPGTVTL